MPLSPVANNISDLENYSATKQFDGSKTNTVNDCAREHGKQTPAGNAPWRL
jgi:hypothetical protein